MYFHVFSTFPEGTNISSITKPMQENGTLPVGPVEIGETHYANSRLGCSVFAARVWKCEDDKYPLGRMFTFVSRVIEKSALYLILLFNTIWDTLQSDGTLDGISTVAFWSDCGPNYRSNRFLGACNYTWPAKYRKHVDAISRLECHMKGKIDGHFGYLRGRKDEFAAEQLSITSAIQRNWSASGIPIFTSGLGMRQYASTKPSSTSVHQCQRTKWSLASRILGVCHCLSRAVTIGSLP
jgi:hypothetical protein